MAFDLVAWAKKLVKAYLVFALLNVSYKITRIIARVLRAKRIWKHVPGYDADPSGKALIANSKRLHDFMAQISHEFPTAPLVKLPMPAPVLLMNNAESVQWMLKDEFANITKPGDNDPMFEAMRKFLGTDGIFVLRHGNAFKDENSTWHKERKVSSLIFTKANFESIMYDTFVEKAHLFNKRLEKSVDEDINIQELFFSYTMDSIEKFFMGTEVDTVSGGMSEYAKAFDTAHNAMVRLVKLGIPMDLMIRLFLPYPIGSLKSRNPTTNTLAYKVYSMFNEDNKIFDDALKKLSIHIHGYIKETRSDPNMKQRKDIIANFLNSSIGDEMTDKMLHDIVLNLTIAGRDTTACALSWLFFELTQNPEVQEKLIEEIKEKLNGKVPTLQDIEPTNMPYLHGAFYEALRLHPSVPLNQKVTEKDLTYPDGTLIPKDSVLFYSPHAMGRNPTVYKNPLKFDPNRWIPFQQPSLYEFPVFQAGPRFCLGKDMAQFEAKLLTAMILQKFSFTMRPEEAKNISYSMMLTQSVVNDAEQSSFKLFVQPHRL